MLDQILFDFKGWNYYGIAMEFMPLGDLETFIEKKKEEQSHDPNCWTENEALRLIAQLVSGLSYLHEHEIIHRDIKPSNIFLGNNGRLAIGDFGISDTLATTRMTKIIGTDNYLPPEAIEQPEAAQMTFARDIWSTGVVVYMISYLKHPFAVSNRMRTMTNIYDGKMNFAFQTTVASF